MKIKIRDLEKLVLEALLKKYDKKDANLMLPVIMFGEISGRKSHGIIRVAVGKFGILAQKPKGKPQIINESSNSVLIEGRGNPGMLVGAMAMGEAIRLAKKKGIGIVGTKGSFGSSGCLSCYLEKIAKKDLIGIIMARAPADVAPHGGLERLFGTNPMSFGIPSDKAPLIFDMATSAISYGAVLRAKSLGAKIPENVAIDEEGKVTRDPVKAMKGAFLPFDRSYEGAGLAMMVEILAGILPGAGFLNENEGDGWGNLFIAIDPKLFLGVGDFKKKTKLLVETVRNSKTKDGSKVRISGENTLETRDKTTKAGLVEVDDNLIESVRRYVETGELP